jgi:hypothetical protein
MGMRERYRLGVLYAFGWLYEARQLAQIVHRHRLIKNRQGFISYAMADDVEIGERPKGIEPRQVFGDDGEITS